MGPIRAAVAAIAFLLAFPACAEKGDREKPIHIEADRFSMDDINKVQVFEGNVVMVQGTMRLNTDKLVVTEDIDGFQNGVATGGPNGLARFRQKRDGKDEFIEGEAERIVHDTRSEKTEFFIRAWVKSGQDEVRGYYISSEAPTEKYQVNSGGRAKSATGGKQARVRAIIQPKSKPAPAGGEADPLPLQASPDITPN
ncbi:MAG: lipopolysaccharide transport periplasmic protein LptA [Candidatus Accumulibacter sp.]|nr:lipopolysaccharide transport periplasmic protein LptA [Accumulibacter sp.]